MAAKSALPKNLLTSSPFLGGEHLSKRSVFIKVRPAPQNLSQRRAILKVLKKHGRIEVFKALGEPHSFISVTSDSTTAQNLIWKAPLELSYGSEKTTESARYPPKQSAESGGQGEQEPSQKEAQKFFIDIFEASHHPHKRRLSPLSGPWTTAASSNNLTSSSFWPNDISTAATIPGITDSDSDSVDPVGGLQQAGEEPHEDEDLLKTFARRHLEGGYRDQVLDLGWKGMTDWESGGEQGRLGGYREDGENYEQGWRERWLERRWEGRERGGC
ncbi:hypothetical protein B0T21DRAFT_430568 [Apiosordaria backusii]|uniref:Uncharacterized protein n=1 Tax=Apiosordaria backusii TaxID=314023 RepID=A0AA40ETP5_9PEZI|nr:hypothetical protein B0T21DRAFT_430568 [Apiosordaria backusii]